MSNKGIKNSLKSLSLPADCARVCRACQTVSKMKILILNGPNLNLQGRRDTGVYGTRTFETFFGELEALYPAVGFGYFQSNLEGELIDAGAAGRRAPTTVWCSMPADIPIRRWRCAMRCRRCRCPVVRGAHLVDPRARGVPPRLALGSRGRGLDHGFRAGFLPAGRRGPVAPRQGVSPGFPERPFPGPGRGGSACGRPLPGCSRGACAGAGTGRNVKCRNTNILASYFYV